MKALLDTHAFIWWDSAPDKLSPRACAACQDRANLLLFSVARAWEMQMKLPLDKLRLRLPLAEVIAEQQQTNNIQVLPVALAHVLALQGLSAHHKDPFDRLLIAQANAAEAILISHDPVFVHYPVEVRWCGCRGNASSVETVLCPSGWPGQGSPSPRIREVASRTRAWS